MAPRQITGMSSNAVPIAPLNIKLHPTGIFEQKDEGLKARAEGVSAKAIKLATQSYEIVTDNEWWRHIVGRISSLVRILPYTIALIVQIAKTTLESLIFAPIASGLIATGLAKEDRLRSVSWQAVGKDAIMLGVLADRIVNSVLCVLFAPPKSYRSLGEATKNAIDIAFIENMQHKLINSIEAVDSESKLLDATFKTRPATPAELCEKWFMLRAQYHKQILNGPEINHDELNNSLRFWVKAG